MWGLTSIEKQSHLVSFLYVFRVTTVDSHVKLCVGGVDQGSEQVDRRKEGVVQPIHHPALPCREREGCPQ